MFRRVFAYFVLIALAAALTGCATSAEGSERPHIVATDFPCYDFARAVAGDMADITLLIKPGSEVHTYEPAPGDMLSIAEADLFIYIGGESDSWADGMLGSMGDDAPEALNMFGALGMYSDDCAGENECFSCEEIIVCEVAGAEDHDHEHDHEHDHTYDEHIWTNPVYAMEMVQAVCDALCGCDEANAEAYRANAEAYISQIAQIHAELQALTGNSARGMVVFGDRFPFYHMAEEYGIEWHAAFPGCAAETEPSAQTIMELIGLVEENDIPAIYVIEMSTGNVASAIADETGAEILTLHSVQNVSADEFDAGETYVSIMRKNVEALGKGLN